MFNGTVYFGNRSEVIRQIRQNSTDDDMPRKDWEYDMLTLIAPPKEPVHEFWLEDGCRNSRETPLVGKFLAADVAGAKIQCCSTGSGTQCVRKIEGVCFSGKNSTTSLVTYEEAEEVCRKNLLRLCSRKELLSSEDELGCCGTGCDNDDAYVWTSTHSFDSLKLLYTKLAKEVMGLRSLNADLKKERADEEERVRLMRAQFNSSITITTTPVFEGLTNDQVSRMLRKHKRLSKQFDGLAQENHILREQLVKYLKWSKEHKIVKPTWQPEFIKTPNDKPVVPIPEEWHELPSFDLSWTGRHGEHHEEHHHEDKHQGPKTWSYDVGHKDSAFWPLKGYTPPQSTDTQSDTGPRWVEQPEPIGHTREEEGK